MSNKLKKFSASSRERKNRNDPEILVRHMDNQRTIIGQPPLAVDAICLCNRAVGVGSAKQSRPDPVLALAHCVAQIPGSVLAACRYREPFGAAPRFGRRENRIV